MAVYIHLILDRVLGPRDPWLQWEGRMTKKTLGLSATLAGLFLVGVAMLTAQVSRPGDTLQLWEYHTEIVRSQGPGGADQRSDAPRRAPGSSDAMLNTWGRDGWELVGFARREIRVDDVMQTETTYAFKRPTRSVNR